MPRKYADEAARARHMQQIADWQAAHTVRIALRLHPDVLPAIDAAARAAGQSRTAYIMAAVRDRMAADGFTPPDGAGAD